MDDLPDEIVSNILEYLDPVTKLRISLVNRRFYEIATDPLIHRYVTFKTWDFLPEKIIVTYLKLYGSSIRSLNLQDIYWLGSSFMSVIQQSCSHLTHLNLMGSVEIPVNVVVTIFKHNRNLRHFGWTIALDLLVKMKNINSGPGRQALEQVNGIAVLFERLTSLKLGLMVYSTISYRDGFEPEAALFTHILSRIISPKLQTLTVTCLDRGYFMQHPKQSRVLTELNVNLGRLDNNTSSVMDLKNHFENTRHELTIAAITKHDGIIKGWLKYVTSNKTYTIKSLETPGTPFLNYWIPLLGNGLSYCEIQDIKSLDINSSHDVPIYWMISVLRANSLTFLNVSNMECVTGYLLEILSETSPCLESLNVQGCHGSLDPIGGLRLIAKRCHHLHHLNLGRIHHHSSGPSNDLLEILSNIKYLKTVSLSGCSVIPCKVKQDEETLSMNTETIALKNDTDDDDEADGDDDDTYADNDSWSTEDDSDDIHDDNWQCTLEKHHCLQTMMESCTFLRQIEIISVGFHSVLRKGWVINRPPPERADLIWDCPDNEAEHLKALAFCPCLEKLTIAGLDVRGGLEFLCQITSSCRKLYFLSLAQLRGLEMAGALPTLNKALSKCSNLKHFRFEQSYFAVPQSFTTALFDVKCLESLCIITKGGSIAISTILPLFEKCQKLRVLQICADVSSSEETFRNLTNILYNRYSSERPGLAVCLFPYDSNTRDLHDKLFNHAHENCFPLVHLKNLSLFRSEVATRTF